MSPYDNDDDSDDFTTPRDVEAVQKAAEADALTIWTVYTTRGGKAVAVELSFKGKDFGFKHTFRDRKDAEETVDAFQRAIENCWPTLNKNLH